VSICVKKQILGFQIPVCDTFALMEEFEDQDYFGGVETGGIFGEAFGFS
jgi:hypothetical protein